MSSYRIHVSRDNLMFAAGHFVSYDGDLVEPLHGHNYRMGVTVEGALGGNAYVFNFVTLKRLMKQVSDELDHRMLLPRDNPLIVVEAQPDGGVLVRVGARWYRFPQEDVLILPVSNTTAEQLAQYCASRIRDLILARADAALLTVIEVSIEETFGQEAIYREQLPSG